jgi:energy-coupling factor transport system permease protein
MTAASPVRPRLSWRIVDIVVAAVVAVACGVLFFAWNVLSGPVTDPLEALLPGLQGLGYGVWLVGGLLTAAIVRKPGAALFGEIVAASVSALLGAQWGPLTIEAGVVQGIGAELIFALFLYRHWRMPVFLLAGAAAGLAMAINDLVLWYAGMDAAFRVIYPISCVVSGAVVAGLGSLLLTRALAATGALSRFAAGRETAVRV